MGFSRDVKCGRYMEERGIAPCLFGRSYRGKPSNNELLKSAEVVIV